MIETPKDRDLYEDVPFPLCPLCGMMNTDFDEQEDKICRCGFEWECDE